MDLYAKAADVYSLGHDKADHDSALGLAASLPDPMMLQSNAPVLLPAEHNAFMLQIEKSRKELNRAFGEDRINSAVQQLLALSVTNRDVGMIVLAAQAYSLEARAQSVAAESATVTRVSPTVWTSLDGPGSQPVGTAEAVGAATAVGELSQAADAVGKAVGPLATAGGRALTGATLLDLRRLRLLVSALNPRARPITPRWKVPWCSLPSI